MLNKELFDKLPQDLRLPFAQMHNHIVAQEEELHRLRRQLYGIRSEKHHGMDPIPLQTQDVFGGDALDELGEETEKLKAESLEKLGKETPKSKRSPLSGGRHPLPENLERRRVVHDVKDSEKICPHDGSELTPIGEEVVGKLNFIPSRLEVVQHVYPKYACKSCSSCVAKAHVPPQALPQCQCENSLVARVIYGKFVLGLPLYRQEQDFKQLGMPVSRTSLARWVIQAADFLQPLTRLIKTHLLSLNVLHADETTLQVLKDPSKKKGSTTAYLWTLCAPKAEEPAYWFEYHPTRSSEAARKLLGSFSGLLHSDGYNGYNSVASQPGITRVGCWAHVRRKFDVAKKDGSSSGKSLSETFLNHIQALYKWEREWTELDSQQKLAMRQEFSEPIVKALRGLLDEWTPKVPPRSKL